MKFENIRVYNFQYALRGMRNPKNSWANSDSFFGLINLEDDEHDYDIAEIWNKKKYPDYPETYSEEAEKSFDEIDQWLIKNGILQKDDSSMVADVAFIGPDDMRLAQTLIKSGPEHRKFLRQIFVTVDITAPLYW
jgi:hypothetical protein